MTPSLESRVPAALRFASFVMLAVVATAPRAARAQDPGAVPSGAAAPAAAPVPPPSPDPAPAGDVPPAPPQPDESPGLVEHLPREAFPEWKQRGIDYGSLRTTTMHGMQWPYIPRNGVGVSGDAWLDTGYERIDRGTMSTNEAHTVKYMLQQGRAVFRLTPTYTSGTWFLQAQAELVANKDQTVSQPNIVDIDDLWVRTGNWKTWDVTIGRFQGFEVYHLGMGLDINTLERNGATDDIRPPPGIHGFQYGFLRPPNVGNVAFHVFPSDIIRLELLAQLGNEGGLNTVGGRPAIIVDFGWLKLKAAGEGRKQSAIADTSFEERTTYGGTGAIQFILYPYVEFGLNADFGRVEHYSATKANPTDAKGQYDRLGTVNTLSFGGFANLRVADSLLVGLGANNVSQEDDLPNTTTGDRGKFSHLQGFVAVQYVVNKKLYIKAVGGYGRAHLAPSTGAAPWDNSMGSGRIRLQYLF